MGNGSRGLLSSILACLSIAAVLVAALLLWNNIVWPMKTHQEWYKRVRADIYSLAENRPADVPTGQWEFAIGWTVNLHANCGADFTQVDASKRESFAAEFEEKLRGPIDMSIIDWIWDQYELITQSGKLYSERYRPTKSDELKHAEKGCFGIPVR